MYVFSARDFDDNRFFKRCKLLVMNKTVIIVVLFLSWVHWVIICRLFTKQWQVDSFDSGRSLLMIESRFTIFSISSKCIEGFNRSRSALVYILHIWVSTPNPTSINICNLSIKLTRHQIESCLLAIRSAVKSPMSSLYVFVFVPVVFHCHNWRNDCCDWFSSHPQQF